MTGGARARLEATWSRANRFIPWVSLALSIAGAVVMDRGESRAGMVALGSAASWVVLVALSLSHRPRPEGAESTGALRKVLRFTTTAASQSLVQMSLFFSAPFYVEACVWTLPELGFAALFVLSIAVTLWDPLCQRVLLHPLFGPLLFAFASFVAWNAALPMLGVPHRTGVWLAAGAVGLASPLVDIARPAARERRLGALAAGLGIPLTLLLGGVRALPPAPLRVVSLAIGTRVQERVLVDPTERFAVAPSSLVCFTAVRAPHGLADALIHEWRHDGKLTNRIVVDVRGGRRAGFRTWSRLAPGKHAHGTYRCDVVTALGQTLGSVEVDID